MEQYVGMDISQKETAICVIDSAGARLGPRLPRLPRRCRRCGDSPGERLTEEDARLIRGWKAHLIALLDYHAPEEVQ